MESINGGIDVQRLIAAVAARHGILLKSDDAAFALVTINQLVLEDVLTEVVGKIERTVEDFDAAAARVQAKAGGLLASEVKEAAAAIRRELGADIAAAGHDARALVLEVHRAHSRVKLEKWMALGVICGLVLFLCGVFVGRMFR
jgi:hypothetical protein